MEIYFVRHGETSGNVEKRHQAAHGNLTEKGHKQASDVAEVIRELKPTHLLTSSMVRAIETTRYISSAVNLDPETSHSFIELVRPEHLHGHYHRSVPSVWFYLKWYLGLSKGGESYFDLRNRFKEAEAEIASYPNDAKLVVVSHAVFISLFVAHLCNERALWSRKLFSAIKAMLVMTNTQITKVHFEANSNSKVCPWTVER